MATAKFFDRYQSTLSAAYTSGGTSLSVTSAGSGASALPATGDFWVIIEAEGSNTEEVLKVTARSGTTLTVTGAQAGTAASNHASAAVIRGPVLTADAIAQLKPDIVGGMTAAAFNTETSNGTTNPEGRRMVVISDEDTLCMWTGSVWKFELGTYTSGGIHLADYTWTNQGAATATEVSGIAGGVSMSVPAVGGTNWRILKKAVPGSTPWIATLRYVPNIAANIRSGLVLIDSGGKLTSWGASGDGARAKDNWNSVTSWSGGDTPFSATVGQSLEVRIENDGTNLKFYKKLATEGGFSLMATVAVGSFLGTLSSIGFGIDGENNAITDTFYSLIIS